jgi:P-type conjugative transfer protein TrbL
VVTDGNLLNDLLATLTRAFQLYEPQLLLVCVALLSVLAFIQFFYIAVDVAINHDLPHMMTSLSVALIKLGMVYVIMNYAFVWGDDIIQTGVYIGQRVSGQSPNVLTPSGVYQLGLNLIDILEHVKSAGGWLHPIQDLEWFATCCAVLVTWLFAALLYFGLLLEGAVAVAIGPIFVALGGLESTGEALVAWAKTLVAIAVSIAVTLLTIAAGMALVQGWAVQLQDNTAKITTDVYWLILSASQSVAFFYILKNITSMSQGMIGRSAAGLGAAVMGGIGAAVGSAASAGAGAISKAGSSSAAASSGQNSTQSRGWMNTANPDALTDADRQLLGITDSNAPTGPLSSP